MIYTYNEERDRLARKAWDPCYFLAIFKDTVTGATREMPLHTAAAVEKRRRTIAEKHAAETEEVVSVRTIPRSEFEKWLCPKGSVTVEGVPIPASFVAKYLIAEDIPSATKKIEGCGDLSEYRMQLLTKDSNLLSALKSSYEATFPEYDIVREEMDLPHEIDPLLEAYKRSTRNENSESYQFAPNAFVDCEQCHN